MTPESATTPRTLIAVSEADHMPTWIDGLDHMTNLARTLETELAAMTARVAELERDAGRYLWIRNGEAGFDPRLELAGDELDAAIDALQEQK